MERLKKAVSNKRMHLRLFVRELDSNFFSLLLLVLLPFFIFFFCGECLFLSTVDREETMEETILVGDDLMRGPPSPVVPKEIASHVLEGVELCDGILKNLFLCE